MAKAYYCDSSSDSDSDTGGDASVLRYDDIISSGDTEVAAPGTKMTWTYICHSDRGGEIFGDASKRRAQQGGFKLEFNSTDAMFLEKAKIEVKQSLHQTRLKLFESDTGQPIDAGAALAASIPRGFLEAFHQYLETSLKKDESPDWYFVDLIEFIRCEVMMKLFGLSAKELPDFGLSKNDYESFRRMVPDET